MLVGILLALVLKEGPAVRESDKFFLGLHRHQWSHIHLYLSLGFSVTLAFHLVLEWSWIKGKSQRLFKKAWRPMLGFILAAAVLLPIGFWALTPNNVPVYAEMGFGRGGDRGQPANHTPEGRLSRPKLERTQPVERPQDESRDSPEREGAKPNPPYQDQGFERESPPSRPPEKRVSPAHEPKLVSGRLEGDQAALVITGRMTLQELQGATGIPAGRILTSMGLPGNLSRNETLGRLRRRLGFRLPQLRVAVEALMEKR